MNTLQPRRIQVLLRQLRPDLAEAEARRQLARFPESSQLQALLGLSLIRQNKPAESRPAAERAVALDAQNDFAFYVLSLACLQGGQLQEAALHIATALQLQPVVPDYHFLQGSVAFAEGHTQAALTAADQGLCLHPQHVQCLNLRARALSRLGGGADWQPEYQQALREAPTFAPTHVNLGFSHLEHAQFQQAEAHFLQALALDPTSQEARAGVVSTAVSRAGLALPPKAPRPWFVEDKRAGFFLLFPFVLMFLVVFYAALEDVEAATLRQYALPVLAGAVLLFFLPALLIVSFKTLHLSWQLLRPATRHVLPPPHGRLLAVEAGAILAFYLTLAALLLPGTAGVAGLLLVLSLAAVALGQQTLSTVQGRRAGYLCAGGLLVLAVVLGALQPAYGLSWRAVLLYFNLGTWLYLLAFSYLD
ncbi:tetratricopeptide repeat protein [Hymenobacter canadensis]|uniref:Tetratricopeptide repeat protein n=1 Tax=Hymenobacter canadensis TaxID=2999067 RepID=A0ABY7LSH7_9BACT|nr:tetratricopeptide repeat protein [Hymenobacter canadensis]WBA41858.1 tetratricopeptide repeat protein [Hymenobacter canadensis]